MRNRAYFRKIILIIGILIILLTAVIMAGYNNFTHHRNTVIKQQQEHLLTIAKSISRSLDVFIYNKMNNLFLLAQNPAIIEALNMNEGEHDSSQQEKIFQTFFNKYNEIDRVVLLDGKGKMIYQYSTNSSMKERAIDSFAVNRVRETQQAFIGKEYPSGHNQFSIDLMQPIMYNNELKGILINSVNLNKVYESLIYPIKAGEKGYAMVKNTEGVILMHPVANQIGIESLKVRKEKFPEHDWSELEELHEKQVKEGEGYFVYHSKWWQEDEQKWTKKINAFTTNKIGLGTWIISVQMDYSEIAQPIRGTLINISLIAFIITVILLIVVYTILKIDKKRKALELETKYLKELNKTWEELIRSEERLRHSQKLQTIGTLTSGIAHEFNNLLTPILGYSELLLQDMDQENTMYEELLEIYKSALRAKEIIEQILVFSRNDHVVPKFKYVELDSIVKGSIKLMKSILPNHIKIVENLSSNELVFGSSTQLQQVLLNLYTNSYHAMKDKDGIVEVRTKNIDLSHEEGEKFNLSKGKYVQIQVKDTGIGMDKETLSQIFDPFFTTKGIGEGTGLGLSVVHGIVENHDGRIIVESQINLGTTVNIYLPIAEKRGQEEVKKEKTRLAGTGNILLIDDNRSVLKVIEKGLKNCGYHVFSETDGYEAMKRFDQGLQDFHVVILDYTMPNINGLEIAKHFKMKNPDVKIILVSGFIKEDLVSSYSKLFDDYMLKPISISELINKIENLNKF